MPESTDAIRLRVVIVNFDESWSFPDLVRRHALDVFAGRRSEARRRPEVEIRFRTIGGRDPEPIAAQRLAAWGASRPRAYGDDWQSLTDDLLEDVEFLVDRKVEQLAVVCVFPDPDLVPAGEPLFERAISVLADLETTLAEHAHALSATRRYVCVRQTELRAAQPRLAELIDGLLVDPAGTGRQPADQVFVLRPPSLRPADLDSYNRHFLLLRVAVEAAVARVMDSDAAATGTSPVGELLNMKEPLVLSIEGTSAMTTSAKIAAFVAAYRQHVDAAGSSQQSTAAEPTSTTKKVQDLLSQIKGDIRSSEIEFGLDHLGPVDGNVQEGEDTDDDAAVLSSEAREALSTLERDLDDIIKRSRWWTAATERALLRILEGGPPRDGAPRRASLSERVQQFVNQTLKGFEEKRVRYDEETIQERDADYRRLIAAIPVGGGGLAGSSQVLIDRIVKDIGAVREDYRRRAELARKHFMGALLPERQPGDEGRRRPEPARFHEFDLDRVEAYHEVETRLACVRAACRAMVPRAYATAWVALSVGAGLTVLTHAIAKTKGDLTVVDALFTRSGALLVAVAVAAVLGYRLIQAVAHARRVAMRQTVDDLVSAHAALWRRVQAMTDRAIDYIMISRQLVYFDLLEVEMRRRISEADAKAFRLAVEDMRPPETVSAPKGFFSDMDQRLFQLPVRCWVREILDAGSFPAAAPALLTFERREYRDQRGVAGLRATGMPGIFTTSSTLFTADQSVSVTPLRLPAVSPADVPGAKVEPLS